MNIKYNKILDKNKKVVIYIFVGNIFIACNIIVLINSLVNVLNNSGWQIVVFLSSFFIECLGFFYCLFQDIANLVKLTPTKFVFDNDPSGIPFVDRKELLEEIILESAKKIKDNNYYYIKNIRYGERNGKTAFAKRLCYEYQMLKDRDVNAIQIPFPNFYKQIGSIIYIDYANYADSFNSRIKTEFTYIKGKKNIVVIDNSYEDLCLWTEDLADKDIFFIFLNFNTNSEDALFFADDKIYDLLNRLHKNPAFSFITAGCILRSLADSDAFQSGRCAEHNGRPETLAIIN